MPEPARTPTPRLGRHVYAFWHEKFGTTPHAAEIVIPGESGYDPISVSVTRNPYSPDDYFQLEAWPPALNVYDPLTPDERQALVDSGVVAWLEWPPDD